jgi:hypothetical protein
MVTRVDERKGLVKTCWAEMRERIAQVEPEFARLIDEVDPGNLPMYLAYYHYGVLKGDTQSTFLPDENGGYYRLLDLYAPKEVIRDLGYGIGSSPFGMVLEKQFEHFIHLTNMGRTLPWQICKPGTFFPQGRLFSRNNSRIYAPNTVVSTSSGVRSTFMLPEISCKKKHANLQRDFNIKLPPPQSLYEHWQLFATLARSTAIHCDWRSSMVYFSEQWVKCLYENPSWVKIRLYLHGLGWDRFEFERNKFYYIILYSIIQEICNLKPNPYVVDTAQHLIAIALGEAPGYSSAMNNEGLPTSFLQRAYDDSYALKYKSIIMQPSHFKFEHAESSVYYSLQHPSTLAFSPTSRRVSTTLVDLRELQDVCEEFMAALATHNMCAGTVLAEMANRVELKYFHNKLDKHGIITPSSEIPVFDKQFNTHSDALFAKDAAFLRGCININVKR